MNSRILLKYPLSPVRLQPELEQLLRFPYVEGYSEFIFGKWKTCVLYNRTGSLRDNILSEYDGPGRYTSLMKELKWIACVLRDVFHLEHLKWMRVFYFERGVILPHRDYLELNEGYTRLHLPIQTGHGAWHSEDMDVFHMQQGEVWYLDATSVHSACNFSGRARLSLCLDFDPQVEICQILRTNSFSPCPKPHMVQRPEFTEEDVEQLLSQYSQIDATNFRQVIAKLSEVHFRKKASTVAVFEWLKEIARRVKSAEVTKLVEDLETFAILRRPSVPEILTDSRELLSSIGRVENR